MSTPSKGKTSFKRMRFFLWSEINLFEICEMCFARKKTTFGCCEMPAGVRRFISFHIAAKTQYITMHSTLVCEALFHILCQQNISLKTNRWRPSSPDRAGRRERRKIMVKFALRQVNCLLRERQNPDSAHKTDRGFVLYL